MDGVKLSYEPDALRAMAALAIKRRCGARGLRAIIENVMMDTMFELPSIEGAKEVIITAASVNGEDKPVLVMQDQPVLPEA